MANLSFSFNGMQRSFYNVTLPDNSVIQVKMPKKSTFSKLQALSNMKDNENSNIDDIIDTFGGVVAEILSNNLNNKKFTVEDVTDKYGFDIEEMEKFISEYYQKFVGSIAENPN